MNASSGKEALGRVRATNVGQVATSGLVWRCGSTAYFTAIVKACFTLRSGETVVPCQTEAVRASDEHDRGHPMRSVIAPRELWPQAPLGEITLRAKAQSETPQPEMLVRLTAGRDQEFLLNKSLRVVGDRTGGAAPTPFTSMAISYENALGGIGFAGNPLGTGLGDSADQPPNIVDVMSPKEVTVGFGPIPASFPSRRAIANVDSGTKLNESVLDLPDAFNASYFQSAPADQCLKELVGNEWFRLEGMSIEPENPFYLLPGGTAQVQIVGLREAPPGQALSVPLNSLHIDAVEGKCSLIHRLDIPLAALPQAGSVSLVGAFTCGEAIAWPDVPPATTDSTPSGLDQAATPGGEALGDLTHTTVLGSDNAIAPPASTAHAATPFAAAPEHALAGTQALDPNILKSAGKATPFQRSMDSDQKPESKRDSSAIPGAPWAAQPEGPPSAGIAVEPHALEGTALLVDPAELIRKQKEQASRAQEAQDELDAQRAADEVEKKKAADELAARAKAEKRRQDDAERFRSEQEAAVKAAAERKQQLVEEKKKAADDLRNNMYGSFKRRSK